MFLLKKPEKYAIDFVVSTNLRNMQSLRDCGSQMGALTWQLQTHEEHEILSLKGKLLCVS